MEHSRGVLVFIGYIKAEVKMKILLKITVLLGCLMTLEPGLMAQDHSMMSSDTTGHTMMRVAEFKWMDAPPGLPKGAKVAVLSGDPSKVGPFTIRVSFPKNYTIRPHWHPTAENVTVIEGTFYMGTQATFDKQKAGKLEKGDFAVMPAKFVHYAFCNDPTVIQIHGMGPFVITYVNKSDDPRNMR
jgi:quercetin dioxygenase-like cupin family protein